MTRRTIKLRWRRRLRRPQLQVGQLGLEADRSIDRHFINRLGRLWAVRRFVAGWLSLIILLSGCLAAQLQALGADYQTRQFVPGGSYSEGILGDFTTANPLYAVNPVDSAVAHLVFSGLFAYNAQNQLVGNLAQSWQVDASGKVYTIQLKPHLTWQDGRSLTAADVVFTYQTIQNPAAQSPLATSFQDVTVAAHGSRTVIFTLGNPLSSFIYSLTNGIVPAHLLASVPPAELRGANFNVADPVGSGPFAWQSLAVEGITPQTRQEQISLTPFQHYAGGTPKLASFIVHAFHNQQQLISSFRAGAINGLAGLNNVPAQLQNDHSLQAYSLPLTAANMVFFKTTSGVLSDTAVRQALVEAADVNQLIVGLGYPAIPVREPLLNHQLGYNASYQQTTGQPLAAAQILTSAGWLLGKNGVRTKAGQPLSFALYAANTADNRYLTSQLQKQWQAIGANAQIILQNSTQLEDTVTYHTYDALLYGISIGVDPDVFVYWDSSQAKPSSTTHLNFSEYQNATADEGLEAGRTVSQPALRAVKYASFLQAWQQDAPALALYQPRFLYLTNEPVQGLSDHTINQATDRFNNVQAWEVQQANVTD